MPPGIPPGLVPPGPPPPPAPPPVDAPGAVPAAPSSFGANPSDPDPSVAIAHYDPQTGQYAAPGGTVGQQIDLVDPPHTWQDLIFRPGP